MNQLPMTQEQSTHQNQDATRVTHDPTLNKDAVEQALEDLTIGIEDRS